MKLFYSPGACSLGIHVILEEIGKPYDTHAVNLKVGEQYQPDFMKISPKSKVPALQRNDGTVVTEFGAIATWLARTSPEANLIPQDPDHEARMVEAMDYIVATVHMQGFTRTARPGNFTPNEADIEAVKAKGREIYSHGLKMLDHQLEGHDFLAGPYSLADAALFYVSNWAPRAGVTLPDNIAAHFDRMKQRPAVQRAMAAEGLS